VIQRSFEPLRRFLLPSFLNFGYLYTLWTIIAYIPLYLDDLAFSHLQISILISIFPLTSLILMIPSGIFSDRLPSRYLITTGFVLLALFLTGMRYAEEFMPLLLLFVIGGAGGSLIQISCRSLYYKVMGEGNTGKKLGFFMGIGLLGYAFGPLIGGFLLTRLGIDSLLWITSLILLPFIFLSLLLEDVKTASFELGEYRRDIARKEVIVLVALTFVVSLHVGVEQTSLSLFLREDIGLNDSSIGLMFCFIGLGIAALSVANGFVSDSLKGRRLGLGFLLYLGMFLSGLFHVNLLFVSTFVPVLVMRLFHIVGDSLFIVSRMVIISNLFLPGRIGGHIGLIEATITAGTFAGALISGAIPGYLLPFVVIGLLVIMAIPPAMAARPKF